MITRRQSVRMTFLAIGVAAAAVLAGCGTMDKSSNMVALSTQLRAGNEVPMNASSGTGTVDAALNKDTNLLRWKVTYSGLTGPASAGHFHGPAAVGSNAGVVVPWQSAMSGSEGSATLTPAQTADLLAGRWYANIHTAANPGGEVRGQMMVRN